MSDDLRAHDADDDLSADTERFRRFARRDDGDGEVATGGASSVSFRLLMLIGGLVVLALVVWLLL
jgi:hypothetical protein